MQTETNTTNSRVRLAAFDFDGTSIEGNSPVILVWYLWRHGLLKKRVLLKILLWAAAYAFHLPQSEPWVRGLVFTAFEGKPKEEVDAYLMEFYDEAIEKAGRFRPEAQAVMEELQKRDIKVAIVSASFEPIIRRAMSVHPIDIHICTTMQHDCNGCYTTKVDGECVEGEAKVTALQEYADATYGKGNWELVCAFGDHYSDVPLLSLAQNPVAVDPDFSLSRCAKRKGWDIADWSLRK